MASNETKKKCWSYSINLFGGEWKLNLFKNLKSPSLNPIYSVDIKILYQYFIRQLWLNLFSKDSFNDYFKFYISELIEIEYVQTVCLV